MTDPFPFDRHIDPINRQLCILNLKRDLSTGELRTRALLEDSDLFAAAGSAWRNFWLRRRIRRIERRLNGADPE